MTAPTAPARRRPAGLEVDPLAKARAREAEAIRMFRLALAEGERGCAHAARLLAQLDEHLAAACARLRQAGYLRG